MSAGSAICGTSATPAPAATRAVITAKSLAWGYAVARFTVAGSTAALYLVPPVAIAVAFVCLGERPRPVALAGGGGHDRRRRPHQPPLRFHLT
jgi:hypothetical protein